MDTKVKNQIGGCELLEGLASFLTSSLALFALALFAEGWIWAVRGLSRVGVRRIGRVWGVATGLVAFALCGVACKSVQVVRVPVKTELPENWFRPSDGPGMLMRRIVVLPVYNEKYTGLVMKDIDDAFLAELSKLNAFEVVSVTRADMETVMGRRELSSVEPISVDFFRKMRDVYGAEGVMFIDLTSYSPYRPVSMGVRCKLVDVQAGRIHWASDALYDAGNEKTAAAARAFGLALGRENFPVREDGGAILLSPKRFARFAAFASFRSLRKDRPSEGAE
jgi:hypothetical protein